MANTCKHSYKREYIWNVSDVAYKDLIGVRTNILALKCWEGKIVTQIVSIYS